MKKTQIKDTLRNVRKHIVSYISVIAVAMLAVAAFLGINYAADALIINASDFETNLNFRDIEITSTKRRRGHLSDVCKGIRKKRKTISICFNRDQKNQQG